MKRLSLWLVSILAAMGSADVASHSMPRAGDDSVIERAAEIRAKLLEADRHSFVEHQRTSIAQWSNWPNWSDWNNWADWPNWNNWSDWWNY
jgi:hypothetical protein